MRVNLITAIDSIVKNKGVKYMGDEELRQLIASNTKAIQALSHSLTESKKE